MPHGQNVFRHVPRLRSRIVDPALSAYRMSVDIIEQWDTQAELQGVKDWRYSHQRRERMRIDTLRERLNDDVWVFAYGSLMWDPGFYFDEVRYASLEGASRSFRLVDVIGRGSPQYPGLMAGLGAGGSCEGLAFRIHRSVAEEETAVIWMREMICPGYLPEFFMLDTPQGTVEGLTFVLDETCESCLPHIEPEHAAALIANGRGSGGTARDYLEKLVSQLTLLGLEDPSMSDLLALVEATDTDP